MKIHEAGENYLECIYILSQRQGDVRATDICAYMGYSRPTVSAVLKQFREEGYVEVDAANHITLTGSGLAIAEKMYERHVIISKLLMTMGVDEETALEDACKMEHDISEATFECMKNHYFLHVHGKE